MKKALILFCVLLASLSVAVSARSEQGLPDLPGGAVTIPWPDFKELIKELIAPPPVAPVAPVPPADYSVNSATYAGRLEGDSAVFSASFAVTILAEKKWVSVPLLSSEAAVSDVTMDGVPVTLSVTNGMYTVITDKPGVHKVSLKFFVPADTGAGRNSLDIPLPEVPSSTLTFSVPRPGLDIQITPAHFRKVTASGGGTMLEAVLPITSRAAISWSPAVREEASGTLRVQAQVNTIISVGEGIVERGYDGRLRRLARQLVVVFDRRAVEYRDPGCLGRRGPRLEGGACRRYLDDHDKRRVSGHRPDQHRHTL